MREQVLKLPTGFPVVGFPREFAQQVHNNCQIFQHRDFDSFFDDLTRQMTAENRWEIIVWSDDNKVLASMCVQLEEHEFQVGEPCLSPLFAYSSEPKLLFRGYRKLFKIAKEQQIPWVCITKEVKPFEYHVSYHKVK